MAPRTCYSPSKSYANYYAHPSLCQKRFNNALNLLTSHLSQHPLRNRCVRSVLRASRSTNVLYLYSEVVMLAIRLPQSIEKRLEKLARRTGRTKTYYVREAILEHLEDIEDLYLAEGALERVRSGEEQTIPLKEVMKRHGSQR